MRESQNLYNLVRSLSKSEKAYFRKYASRHVIGEKNKYTALFDIVAGSNGHLSEKEIKEKLGDDSSAGYFPVIKNYLNEMILKSLGSYYKSSNIDNEIKNDLRFIEILYEKDLFDNCAVILNRSMKRAYKTHNFILILELLKWKKNLINVGVYKGNQFVNLEEACGEEKEIICKLDNLTDYRNISYRVRSLIVGTNPRHKGPDVRKELINVLSEPLLRSENLALSPPALHLYHHIMADINDSLGRNNEGYRYRRKIVAALEKSAEALKKNVINYRFISNYRIAIINLLASGLNLAAYDELMTYIEKLRAMERTYPGKYMEGERLTISVGTLMYELRILYKKGEFTKSIAKVIELESELIEYRRMISESDDLHLLYLIAYGYFGAGRFHDSLKRVNKIINDKDVYKEQKLLITSKLLSLVIHYELGNFELLEYLIKSTYRALKKTPRPPRNLKTAIDIIKQLPNITSEGELSALFQESLFKQKLGKSEEGDLEVINNFTNMAEFDLESWLLSKISGKSFEEVVKAICNQ